MELRKRKSPSQSDGILPLRNRIRASSLKDLARKTVVESFGTQGVFHKEVVVEGDDARQLYATLADEVRSAPNSRSIPIPVLIDHQHVSSVAASMPLLPDERLGQAPSDVPEDILLAALIVAGQHGSNELLKCTYIQTIE